ncbi:hypothetical protein QAD02_023062 [Eretmocerus hayati]|uniref:Uncharacterized protein n=1 Tax=Eretmocerus hayati TaxID=131215 RepID=A0ACC2PWE3_9HYME|nr:hypothetical protein QAD02_023062 [Eretmocerus hayati]
MSTCRSDSHKVRYSKDSVLQLEDYIVIGVVLMISASIGLYYRFTGGRQKTVEEYFSANKSMSIVPLGIALMVSFVSAIAMLGISAEIYAYGTQFVMHYIGIILATIVVAYFYLPVFFELNAISVYEYLERRFGTAARLATSMANFIQLTLYTGVVLYAPSLALEATTGLSRTTSILLVAVSCVFYSTIGGIKAVLVTDIFQAVLMFGSLVCIIMVADGEIEGGLGNVWDIADQNDRLKFFDFQFDPTLRHTFWCLLSAGFFLFCSLYGVNQVEVQRLLTAKSLNSARKALFLNLPLLIGFGLMTSYCGLVLFAVFKDCDPMKSGAISRNDRIMPYFAALKMSEYPGLTGLFISGVFSASLSTISATLNSLAAIFLEDYLKRIFKKMNKTFPADKATFFGKILATVIGCICIGIAFLAHTLGSLVPVTISIMGAICGPVLGMFTLGMFFERANEKGAIVGMVTAITICMWASFGRPRPLPHPHTSSTDGCDSNIVHSGKAVSFVSHATEPPPDPSSYFYLYRISYMWYSGMGMVICVIVGYLASLIFQAMSSTRPIEPDPSLFTPLIAKKIRKRRADAAKTTSSQVFTLDETTNTTEEVITAETNGTG